MKPSLTRRYRRRSTPSRSEGAFFKKESQHEQSFFGEASHETFFQPAVTAASAQSIHRKCDKCEQEDKKMQRMEDKKEEEKVMKMEDKKEEEKVQRQPEKKEEEKVQRQPEKKEEEKVMKKEDKKEEEKIMKAEDKKEEEKVQKKEAGASAAAPGKSVNNYIGSLNSKGKPLPTIANYFFSSQMRYDFSHVKIHADKEASDSAKSLNAKAYTIGNNIVFSEGEYDPTTIKGKKLLAHELTHVMQQGGLNLKVQRSPGSPAGGCGLCYGGPNLAGIEAHKRIENAFVKQYPWVQKEYPFAIPSPTDENAVLDLIEFDGASHANIGEIKPANAIGFIQGDLDLFWYEDQLKKFGMTVGRMNLPPPFAPIPFPTLSPAACTQTQMLFVNAPIHGIYTYFCEPDYSVLIQECDCIKGKRRQVNKACQAAGCSPYTYCGAEKMVLENCGSGTCPTCPAGGNMVVKGWCTYASESSEQRAIILRMRFFSNRKMCDIY